MVINIYVVGDVKCTVTVEMLKKVCSEDKRTPTHLLKINGYP